MRVRLQRNLREELHRFFVLGGCITVPGHVCNERSVTLLFIDDVLERFALDEALEVGKEELHRFFIPGGRVVGAVGREEHVIEVPEWGLGWERFLRGGDRGACMRVRLPRIREKNCTASSF